MHVHSKDLDQYHAGSLVVGSVSGKPSETRLVDSISFLVVSLSPVVLTIEK